MNIFLFRVFYILDIVGLVFVNILKPLYIFIILHVLVYRWDANAVNSIRREMIQRTNQMAFKK